MSHLEKLRSLLGKENPDAILISSEVNQRYISHFAFTDGYVLVTSGKSYLVTDFRYIEAAKAQSDKGLEVIAPAGRGLLGFISDKLAENDCKSVGFEEATLSYSGLERMKKMINGVEFVPGASKLIDGLREFKDEEEIAATTEAQRLTDAAFDHILKFIKPEMTEIEVALELEFFMRRNGAEGIAFETIAVSGRASSMPHGVPRNVPLERGFLTMDYGAKVNGYCADMTRTIVIGRADDEMKKLYNTVLRAQLSALSAVREGAENRAVDRIARDIIDAGGYAGCFGHGLGHGVGMYIHEAPSLSTGAREDARLVRGQIVTVEPGIYIEGKYGCRIEDMVLVTENGCHDFTQSRKDLIEIC